MRLELGSAPHGPSSSSSLAQACSQGVSRIPRERAEAARPLEAWAQNRHSIASATFY